MLTHLYNWCWNDSAECPAAAASDSAAVAMAPELQLADVALKELGNVTVTMRLRDLENVCLPKEANSYTPATLSASSANKEFVMHAVSQNAPPFCMLTTIAKMERDPGGAMLRRRAAGDAPPVKLPTVGDEDTFVATASPASTPTSS